VKLVRFAVIAALSLGLASTAGASTITLSLASSDETPFGALDATFEFNLTGASELTLTVTNDTTAPDEYNISEVFFNAASHVTGLTLTSATHSVIGNVFTAWNPVETNTMVDGFGAFDFGLTDGLGEPDVNLIGPGEAVDFVFAISGTGPFYTSDFVAPNNFSWTAAAKFVNGPGDDSAFGAVPEPTTALLLGAGLLVVAGWARHRF
jgi:hypothetical protein